MKTLRLLLVLLLGGATCVFVPTGTAVAAGSGGCRSVQLPVALSPQAPATESISGTLCVPTTWAKGAHRVDLLMHGATYSEHYWDFALRYPQYSYVARTLRSGRATFSFDQLGAGASSKPVSALVQVDTTAYVTHQVITWVRSQGYADVTAIGHSVGSYVAIREAAAFHDVNRLVLTGALHAQANINWTDISPVLLDPGYLETVAGKRGELFYDLTTARPDVIAEDERTKSIVAEPEIDGVLEDAVTPAAVNVSRNVSAPVLLVVGQYDNLFCAGSSSGCTSTGVATAERPYYPAARRLDVVTVAATGHDLALHESAGQSYAAIDGWLRSN